VTEFWYGSAFVTVEADGQTETRGAMGTDLTTTAALFDLELDQGVAVDPSVEFPMLVSAAEAELTGIALGDQIVVRSESDAGAVTEVTTTVIGTFTNAVVADEPYLVDRSVWAELGLETVPTWLAFSLADGVSTAQADAAFEAFVATSPQMEIRTASAYVDDIEGEVDQLLAAVNAMVVLAVIIALVGIANTLALSVFERTRELGLLRAVGMSRRQVRRMIRIEAALVALFGAALGVAVGVVFGWGAVEAMPDSVTDTLSIPVLNIAILVAVSAIAGLVAAWGPARRASRLNVLDAISH
jgi:putative ABC transport system permease protein